MRGRSHRIRPSIAIAIPDAIAFHKNPDFIVQPFRHRVRVASGERLP
jgi:hypothetical protein